MFSHTTAKENERVHVFYAKLLRDSEGKVTFLYLSVS